MKFLPVTDLRVVEIRGSIASYWYRPDDRPEHEWKPRITSEKNKNSTASKSYTFMRLVCREPLPN